MNQLNVSELTEQPESSFEMIAEGGKVKTVRKFEISEETWFSSRPALYSKDPEHSSLTLRRYTANRVPGDLRLLTLYYEGENITDGDEGTGGSSPIPLGNLNVTLGDEPLLSHKNYADIDEKERDALVLIFQGQTESAAGKSLEADITSEEGLQALAKYKKGTTHSREPSVVWTYSSIVSSLTSLNSIGKIDTPKGSVPPIAAGRNWLNCGLTAQQNEDGETFAQNEKWELSGPNGWDPDLYS